ncbi:cupin [Brevibacterium sp. NPDC049920]|uniref:cupin n=1 Tax=Brevibacterium sp. NPDC049920 TaxID=3155279 RepID=UPI003403BF83
MVDITALADELLTRARAEEHGRAAELVVHDGVLRQLVLALAAGAELAEHNAPAAATLQALQGRVRLSYAAGSSTPAVELGAGELTVIGHERHGVQALADSVLVFTTVTGLPDGA